MNKSKVILIIIGILVLAGGLAAGLLLVQQNQNIAQKAAPATTMYVTPGSQTKAPGSTFTYSVAIDTATNAVTGVDIRMTFDPKAIQITSLQQGSGAINLNQTISNTYDNTTGKLQYAIFTLNSSKSITGSHIEILKVNATVKSNAPTGSYSLAFDPATAASASQEGQNVLTSKTQGTLVVGTGTGPTPTPVATRTPTPAATRTPTPAATRTPTPAATRTPTPVGTATPTSNPTATPTATATATTNASPTPTQTAMPIPVTGTDWPTVAAAVFGVFIIIGSVILAL